MDDRLASLIRGARPKRIALVARLVQSERPIHALIGVPGDDGVYGSLRVVNGHLYAGRPVGQRSRLRWVSARRVLTRDRAEWWGEWGLWGRSVHDRPFVKPSRRLLDRIYRRSLEACGRGDDLEAGE